MFFTTNLIALWVCEQQFVLDLQMHFEHKHHVTFVLRMEKYKWRECQMSHVLQWSHLRWILSSAFGAVSRGNALGCVFLELLVFVSVGEDPSRAHLNTLSLTLHLPLGFVSSRWFHSWPSRCEYYYVNNLFLSSLKLVIFITLKINSDLALRSSLLQSCCCLIEKQR